MSVTSFSTLFAANMSNDALPLLAWCDDELRGRVGGGGKQQRAAKLSKGLDARLGARRRFGFGESKRSSGGGSFDMRQRAVVKIHFFGHGGGGAAALGAHMRYVARDAAQRDPELEPEREQERARERDQARLKRESELEAHTRYLTREERGPVFYDALEDQVDGRARAQVWGREDKRHFRIILSAEEGERLNDLKPYVREVMERSETVLGRHLEWVAVDHWDTDNPHTHILLRGRARGGRPLVLPREFVRHGMRHIAREVATARLGERARSQEREALEREARAHRPARLDALIARQIDAEGQLRLSRLRAPDRDPDVTKALKARARELQRLGLADETRRNVLTFSAPWRDRLSELEMHLDIRKRLMMERRREAPLRQIKPPTLGRDQGLER
jgi:type IV secretory pathway VirD2 relaxase